MIVESPIDEILKRGSIADVAVHWLPSMGSFQFLADPFGLWRNGVLHVFVETYDYRVRVGAIETLTFDSTFRLLNRQVVLKRPWHLSYPFVFEGEGETWMLPEAHRSNALTLYRAIDFPFGWEAAGSIALDDVAVDATPLFHEGLWWLFFSSAARDVDKMRTLHAAWAERMAGPWHMHPQNPLRVDVSGARPGGTPVIIDGRITLPVQDCSRTYGGAIRPLVIERLSTEHFEARAGDAIKAPQRFAPFVEGLHTLSSAGPITLIDAKRTELSAHGLAIEIRRETRKLVQRLRRPPAINAR